MITPALIAQECSRATYTSVARRYGLTKGAVAGLVYRHRHPQTVHPAPRPAACPPINESLTEFRILELMADGRMRTTTEIAERVRGDRDHITRRLHRLVEAGCLLLVQRHPRGCDLPFIWQEAPE